MKILLLLSICVSFNATALCNDTVSQVGYIKCLFQQLERLEKEIETKQESVRVKIKEWDEDPFYRDQTIELFEQASQSYRSYKQHQCKYEWSIAAGGNGASAMSASCQITLNQQYLKQLDIQLGWFE